MMKTILYALGILVLLFSFSCKKKAAEVNANYVGYWHGYDSDKAYVLTINSDSKAVYESNGIATVTVRGKARIKGSTLKIFTKKFTIDQEPTQDLSDEWTYTMVLSGVTYVKS
jgi:hypothetical protein